MNRLFCSAFLLSVGLFGLAVADTPVPKKVVIGKQAPAFKIKAASGQMIDLADLTLKGPVLVRLTCGCAGCDKELAYFQEINNAYKKQGLTCIFVFKEPDTKVAKYAVEKKLNMIYAVDTQGESWKTFQTKSMPTNFLIEKGGKIAAIAVGCDTSGVLANKISAKAAKVIGTDSVDVKNKVEEKKNK